VIGLIDRLPWSFAVATMGVVVVLYAIVQWFAGSALDQPTVNHGSVPTLIVMARPFHPGSWSLLHLTTCLLIALAVFAITFSLARIGQIALSVAAIVALAFAMSLDAPRRISLVSDRGMLGRGVPGIYVRAVTEGRDVYWDTILDANAKSLAGRFRYEYYAHRSELHIFNAHSQAPAADADTVIGAADFDGTRYGLRRRGRLPDVNGVLWTRG
jgi:hypothetical protein